jgi:hypothetical protein
LSPEKIRFLHSHRKKTIIRAVVLSVNLPIKDMFAVAKLFFSLIVQQSFNNKSLPFESAFRCSFFFAYTNSLFSPFIFGAKIANNKQLKPQKER